MGVISTYYINSSSYSEATGVFTDAALTTVAPDGYYAMDGITRQLINGVLGSPVDCVDCSPQCGTNTITVINGQGVYQFTAFVGEDVGAVRIDFDTDVDSHAGFRIMQSGVTVNKVSTKNLGLLQATGVNPVYIGDNSNYSGASQLLDIFEHNGYEFEDSGANSIRTPNAGSNFTNATYHGGAVMTYGKISSTTNTVFLEVEAPRPNTTFSFRFGCSTLLNSFLRSTPAATNQADACNKTTIASAAYVQSVNGDPGVYGSTSATPGLYDFVFSDPFAFNALGDGHYKISDTNTIEVQDGVIISIDTCGGA